MNQIERIVLEADRAIRRSKTEVEIYEVAITTLQREVAIAERFFCNDADRPCLDAAIKEAVDMYKRAVR